MSNQPEKSKNVTVCLRIFNEINDQISRELQTSIERLADKFCGTFQSLENWDNNVKYMNESGLTLCQTDKKKSKNVTACLGIFNEMNEQSSRELQSSIERVADKFWGKFRSLEYCDNNVRYMRQTRGNSLSNRLGKSKNVTLCPYSKNLLNLEV